MDTVSVFVALFAAATAHVSHMLAVLAYRLASLLAISRCSSSSMEAKPRLLVSDLLALLCGKSTPLSCASLRCFGAFQSPVAARLGDQDPFLSLNAVLCNRYAT